MDNGMSENIQNIQQYNNNNKIQHKSHEKLEVGLNSERKNLSKGKNPLTLTTVICHLSEQHSIMYIESSRRGGYKFAKSEEKVNYVIYMDNIKLCAQNEKKETLVQTKRIFSQDVGIEFSIEKCVMFIVKSGKNKRRKE